MKQFIIAAVILLIISPAVFAEFSDQEVILESGVIDLRGHSTLPSRNGNEPGGAATPEDLRIGSIFLTPDNHARKVVDIYEHSGRTIIETTEPRPEEVFLALYVPDFEVTLGRENIVSTSVADGVTILPPDAGRSDMLSSEFSSPSDSDRSVTWLETDSANDGKDVLSVNINIPLAGAVASVNDLARLKELQDNAKEKERLDQEQQNNPAGQAADGESAEDSESSSKSELDFNASGELWLKGTMRLVEPTLSGGVRRPRLKFSWVSKWWGGYFKISHEDGYIRGGFQSAQQLDMKLTGTLKLSSELRVPLYAVKFESGSTEAIVGVYIKIGVDGIISLGVEFSEYSKQDVEAKCKLVWPFVPVKITGSNSNYSNFAYRPVVAAEAELKTGLYLGADLDVLGIGIMGAEAGGGAYLWAYGYMEPMGIMGYDDNTGSYGDFNDWILSLNAEAGGYGEVTAEILSVKLTLWKQRWPFWEWHNDWEL